VGAAVALGPIVGGALLQNPGLFRWLTGNDWGSVFLINVPIVIVGLIAIARVVPETRNPQPRRLDVVGLLLSIAGLTALIYGIIHASETKNWLAPSVVAPVALGVVIIAVFLWLEHRSDHPSFDVDLFRNRGYAVSLTAVALAFFALSGITFSLPFYLQILRGYDTLSAGLCFAPFAVGQILAAPRSAATVARFGYRPVMTVGLVLVAGALIGLAFVQIDTPIWILLVIFFVFGLGMGNVIAPASTVMQNVLPLARAGAGSAVQNTVRQVGGALGVAIVGTVLATQYATNLERSWSQAAGENLPDSVTAAASESIIATLAVLEGAGQLPAAFAEGLRQLAFQEFLSAMHLTMAISAGVMVLAVLIVGFGLPHITPPQARPQEPESPVDVLIEDEVAAYPQEYSQEVLEDGGEVR
jgi:DHA2 family multidrug resistance protein-like MFS transporter